jgi:hypothetical protein
MVSTAPDARFTPHFSRFIQHNGGAVVPLLSRRKPFRHDYTARIRYGKFHE